MDIESQFHFDNSFAEQMEGFYVPAKAAAVPNPKLIKLNERLAERLGLSPEELRKEGHLIFSGQALPRGAAPIAQVYAGHQFGGFSHQLGDGRAMMLGEVNDIDGVRQDIQLKGSGPTPFSRGGDGKAAIGPVLREYLMGEAMFALGVPTTRMLAAVTTGVPVYREEALPGAIVTRVAASHLRVGTFEFFAARKERESIIALTEYTIARHYPELKAAEPDFMGLLRAVGRKQAELIAKWMSIGFIHGVMNTDNTALSGETIDFGPCAMMDAYHPKTVFSSIDRGGRYAYGNQPTIGQWNLVRFAETLLTAMDGETDTLIGKAEEALKEYSSHYQGVWMAEMLAKIGIEEPEEGDGSLVTDLLKLMTEEEMDYTSSFRSLSSLAQGEIPEALEAVEASGAIAGWHQRWSKRLEEQTSPLLELCTRMDRKNPVYIPRNHKVEEALDAALDDDLKPFETLLQVVSSPYERQEEWSEFEGPAPKAFNAHYKTFCGT